MREVSRMVIVCIYVLAIVLYSILFTYGPHSGTYGHGSQSVIISICWGQVSVRLGQAVHQCHVIWEGSDGWNLFEFCDLTPNP